MTDLATNVLYYSDNLGICTATCPLLALEDTWHWGPSAEATYAYLTSEPATR